MVRHCTHHSTAQNSTTALISINAVLFRPENAKKRRATELLAEARATELLVEAQTAASLTMRIPIFVAQTTASAMQLSMQ